VFNSGGPFGGAAGGLTAEQSAILALFSYDGSTLSITVGGKVLAISGSDVTYDGVSLVTAD
jgi:hypothetical protein